MNDVCERRIETASTLSALTKAVKAELGSVAVFVTRVNGRNQVILASSGIDLPAKYAHAQPLSHSICQHTAAMDLPLAIEDTVRHPLLRRNRAVSDLHIAAYLGAPVHSRRGKATGAVCAVETRQRRWSNEDIDIMKRAAVMADQLIQRPQ